jgi:hypothetical protein
MGTASKHLHAYRVPVLSGNFLDVWRGSRARAVEVLETRHPRNRFQFRGFVVVAGAGYAEYYTASETYWIDLK